MLTDPNLFIETLFLLFFGHFLGDFPLQGDFLSKIKNPRENPPSIATIGLFGHSIIHGGIVFILTGSIQLSWLMFITHYCIDWFKCMGFLSVGTKAFVIDQLLHYLVLLIISIVYCYF